MDEQERPRSGTKEYIIKKISEATTTQERLRTTTGSIGSPTPAWRRLFVENWVYKVIALIFTVMLFYIVNVDKSKDAVMDIDVLKSYMPKNMVITNLDDIPTKLHIRIRGRWSDLTKALQKKLTPYPLDLRGYIDGTQVAFSMRRIKKIIGVPGIAIQSVSPSVFIVRMAPRGEKIVRVEPSLVGELPKGYKLLKDGINVFPPKVRIWGVRSMVAKVGHLSTQDIDLSTINKTTTINVGILYPGAGTLSMEKKMVRVRLPIKAVQGKRRFTRVAIAVKHCPEGYACIVHPRTVRVDLRGPEPDLLKLDSGRFAGGLSIDATDLDTSKALYRMAPNCGRPASISCRITPRAVVLRFVKQQAADTPAVNNAKVKNQKAQQKPASHKPGRENRSH